MAEYVNYLRVFGAPGAARALFGAIQDDTAGLGSVDLNRITSMPVWMREEPLSAGTVRRQGGENCWLDWRQANWGTRWNTLKAQASAAAYDGGDTIRRCRTTGTARIISRMLRLRSAGTAANTNGLQKK